MILVKRPFAETFVFSRPVAADYRDSSGAIVTATVDAPRFDHDATGVALGLRVTAGPAFGQHDAIATVPGWAGAATGTVLHEYSAIEGPEAGQVRRIALYSRNIEGTANGCLRAAVHHRRLIAVPGILRNRGGYVRFDRANWSLGDAIAVTDGPIDGPALADGAGRALIEG